MGVPELRLTLEDAGKGESLGVFDLFLPALLALGDGTLAAWTSGVPASFELCRRVPHRVREAAWNGTLAVAGSRGWLPAFETALRGRDARRLADDFRELEAALSVMSYAGRLLDIVDHAVIAAPGLRAFHPISGEPAEGSDPPFGFAAREPRWRGVDPKGFLDFTLGLGAPDAPAFLSTIVRNPARWFRDMTALEAALVRLSEDGDVAAYRDGVARWNAAQDVPLAVPDHGVVVPAMASSGAAEAVEWCREFLESSVSLVRSVSDAKWGWYGVPSDRPAGSRTPGSPI